MKQSVVNSSLINNITKIKFVYYELYDFNQNFMPNNKNNNRIQ